MRMSDLFDNMLHLCLTCFTCSIQTVQWHTTLVKDSHFVVHAVQGYTVVATSWSSHNEGTWNKCTCHSSWETFISRNTLWWMFDMVEPFYHICLGSNYLMYQVHGWENFVSTPTHPETNFFLYLTFKWTVGCDVVRYNSCGGSLLTWSVIHKQQCSVWMKVGHSQTLCS